MKDEDKKPEDEQLDEKAPEQEEEPAKDKSEEDPEKKPQSEPESEEKPEEKKVPAEEEKTADGAGEQEKDGELDKLRAENLKLSTQLEAIKAGFSADLTEEAVVLAENIAAKEGCDVKTALQKVAEKFPEWKKDPEQRKKEKKGGIKVGAPEGEKPAAKKPEKPAAVKRWNRVNY